MAYYTVDLANGIQLAGPFDTRDAAQKWASEQGAGRVNKWDEDRRVEERTNPEPQEMTSDWVRKMDGAA